MKEDFHRAPDKTAYKNHIKDVYTVITDRTFKEHAICLHAIKLHWSVKIFLFVIHVGFRVRLIMARP